MSTDLENWYCGKCPYTVTVPAEYPVDQYIDTLMRIREHRFAHLVSALEAASDEELMRMSRDDEPWGTKDSTDPDFIPSINSGPVESEDAAYVLAGVTELLRDDLPRARRVWYETNEDGTYNR